MNCGQIDKMNLLDYHREEIRPQGFSLIEGEIWLFGKEIAYIPLLLKRAEKANE
jgi:hypothetical protein